MTTLKWDKRRRRQGAEGTAGDRAARALRQWLDQHGMNDHRVYFVCDAVFDLDDHLHKLAPEATWESVEALSAGAPSYLQVDWRSGKTAAHETGVLRLAKFDLIVGRTYYFDAGNRNWAAVWLFAVRAAGDFARFRAALAECRGDRGRGVWQQIGGEEERIARGDVRMDELMLEDEVRARLEAEVLPFFSEKFAQACRMLALPHRRGVLLHGPPGNGKTTLLRAIACANPAVPAFVLRPCAHFDSDDLAAAMKQWASQAPAMLAIEDLDWLLPKVNVSNFLNLLDGIDRPGAGLLLLATTNHPDSLDPAINNRPGRFDVVIEVPVPSMRRRRDFFAKLLPEMECAAIEEAAEKSEHLSFAHLREIVHRAGLIALRAERTQRTAEDLRAAVDAVAEGNHKAATGFVPTPTVPFGLAQFARKKNCPRMDTKEHE